MPKFNKAFGTFPSLPNGREHQTPASLYIDSWYSKIEIVERWSWERYVQLCNTLRMTPFEMASLVCMPHTAVVKFEANNCLPPEGRRPIALLLTLVEAHFLSELVPDVVKEIFPDLNKAK
jgi:hypothetical protein